MYSKFPIPELVFAVVFNDCGVIIYKYEDSISPGRGLLNDYLISEDSSEPFDF